MNLSKSTILYYTFSCIDNNVYIDIIQRCEDVGTLIVPSLEHLSAD